MVVTAVLSDVATVSLTVVVAVVVSAEAAVVDSLSVASVLSFAATGFSLKNLILSIIVLLSR